MSDTSFIARSKNEKANARRAIAKGNAKIISRFHETYISVYGCLVNYEAWLIEPLSHQAERGGE